MADQSVRIEEIRRLLRLGPRNAQELMADLSISQPTLSRTIREAPELFTSFRISGDRTPKYGALRQLPGGLSPRQTVYRISTDGAIAPCARVEFMTGGATLELADSRNTLYEGLPPHMTFATPSGFLGRQVARAVALEMQFPESLRDWSDDHRVAYLFTRGLNLPGDLVYGDASLEREMAFRRLQPIPSAQKLDHYQDMANQLKDASYGSSAGGEQPKFLSLTEDVGHVIVKFAKRGSRMADLLSLEHLALQSLSIATVSSASTSLLATDSYTFLEVQRFDRIGRFGRIGMLSAGAIDDEYFGKRNTWSEFATRCEQARYLSASEAEKIHVMAAFSELIGNGDRHFENISLLLNERGGFDRVAPAYDILPMNYAPVGAGIDPDLSPITPKIGTIGAKPNVWGRAYPAAKTFWERVQQGDCSLPIPNEFKDLATKNLAVAKDFVAPLIPAEAKRAD
ncbi:HipA domain-containing protein [Pandoraea anhela]|uniref:HipA domain-containing protein n=1 Tax=Pandoraea anhela TaxID=2508295 RepID=UPI00158202CA|nr:HipA domain-containing protein [Pandoraea anhela]